MKVKYNGEFWIVESLNIRDKRGHLKTFAPVNECEVLELSTFELSCGNLRVDAYTAEEAREKFMVMVEEAVIK